MSPIRPLIYVSFSFYFMKQSAIGLGVPKRIKFRYLIHFTMDQISDSSLEQRI